MQAKSLARTRWVCAAVLLAATTIVRSALALEPRAVVLGEVGTTVRREDRELPKALRRALEDELHAMGLDHGARAGRYVLSASLIKLEDGATKIECTVSAVLREEKSGTIRVITEGRARAPRGQEVREVEADVIAAAARGALASLPSAMQ
jgi:hypothetical protein